MSYSPASFGYLSKNTAFIARLRSFRRCESGVTTIDFIVGAAFIAIMGVSALDETRDGAVDMVQVSASSLASQPPVLTPEYYQAAKAGFDMSCDNYGSGNGDGGDNISC